MEERHWKNVSVVNVETVVAYTAVTGSHGMVHSTEKWTESRWKQGGPRGHSVALCVYIAVYIQSVILLFCLPAIRYLSLGCVHE